MFCFLYRMSFCQIKNKQTNRPSLVVIEHCLTFLTPEVPGDPSPAKMCVVEVPFKLYCTVNVCSKFTASIKEKYLLMVNKTIT